MSGQANQLVSLSSSLTSSSSPSSAKLRQPMCAGCEKSLPNQIVFDKIESIIRMMQDEQNGLPVKTAKSFMSKIPSVFTGIDLIQWMMRNLKLEDQQEAIHLANLIASHGYIFPIEDHTLSIKNDCTFYRFQTPCLWPSNNTDPENTDYAVYLCKRTMQGKTRLELADYEAENLARLQKMFSRKWEFIFMQAESQAKVDKKRDKLERKVLDSQERAFWDVYRPVPGCVNTTELDIKKACRLSKSAKRCNECQKVASSASTSASSAAAAAVVAVAPLAAMPAAAAAAASTSVLASSPSPAPSSQQQQQLAEPLSSEPQPQQQHHHQPTRPVSKIADRPAAAAAAAEEPPEASSRGEKDKLPQQQQQEPPAPEEVPGQTMTRDSAGSSGDNKQASGSGGGGGATSSSGREEVEQKEKSAAKQQQQQQPPKQVKHHHHHAHQHHAHHHHHHHHPHGPHGHHHHHHHHRQCAHHKQPTGTAAATSAATAATTTASTTASTAATTTTTATASAAAAREPQLSIPAESILTATVAAATAGWASAKSMDVVEQQQQPAGTSLIGKDEQQPAQAAERKPSSSSSMRSRERRAPGEQQFMRTPSVQVPGCRRKSECNRMHSMAGIPSETSGGLDEASAAAAATTAASAPLQGGQQKLSPADERPASACCSFTSLDREQPAAAAAGEHPATAPRKSSATAAGQSQASEAAAAAITRKGSVQTGQRSPLVSTRSVCATSSSSTISARDQQLQLQLINASALVGDCSSVSPAANHQHRHNIGELERELEALKVRLDRRIGGVKMSKVTQSYLSYFKQWAEYDPFIAQPIPSNPWISDSTELWDSERQTKDVHSRRVRRWAFSLKELLNDPAGREQFHRFLEKEFSAENLKFWDAVQELKRVHSKDVSRRVEAIWQEYLAQDANCPINIDSKSYETSKKNMAKNKNNRYIFDEAAGHVYQLMKNDSYPRYLRSEMYKDYKEASEKKRTNQVAFDVFKPQITTLKHKFNF